MSATLPSGRMAAADALGRRGLLLVSLPRNDVDLARAALQGGADLLKVHVNVHHHASGTDFGTFEEERSALEAILDLGAPTGLVPGEERMVTREEVPHLRRFAFLDAYLTHLPLYLYAGGLPVIPAIPHDFPSDALPFLRRLPGEWAEASLVPPAGYGRPPAASDLVALARAGELSARRLIVPTQRRIHPDDLERYFEVPSVWAVMIGAIVTGNSEAGIAKATSTFRRTLDALFR